MAIKQEEFEIGADLFDFDKILRDAVRDDDELGAAFDAVIETTSGAPTPEFVAADPDLFAADAALLELDPPAPLPAPTHRVRPTPPPLGTVPATTGAPAPRPVRPVETPAPLPASAAPATPTATATVLQRITLSPGLLAVLAVIALLNLGLLAFVVRALTSVQTTVVDVGNQVVRTAESARAEPPAALVEPELAAAPTVAEQPEGPAALERARAQFELGAWERGRQTLFALLAVIDRVPADVRGDVEARARFLLADSWRLEADAFERVAARGTEAAR